MTRLPAFCALGALAALIAFGCGKKAEPPPPPAPAPEQADPVAKAEAVARLKSVGKAIGDYEAANGFLPAGVVGPKGQLGLSWRVAILPHLGLAEAELYGQFNLKEPWDSEHNKKLISRMPRVFASPSEDVADGKTHLRSFAGPLAYIPWAPAPDAKGFHPAAPWANTPAGTLAHGRPLTGITDGTSYTLAVAESQEPVAWTRPDDLPFHDAADAGGRSLPLPKLGGVFEDGFHGLLCDGRALWFPNSLSEKGVRGMITATAGDFGDQPTTRLLFSQQPPPRVPVGVPETLPDAAARRRAVADMQAVVKGIHQYHDGWGYLPAGSAGSGRPGAAVGLSWRVQILRYIGEEKLFNEFKLGEGWDSPHNKALLGKMPLVFASPDKPAEKGHTFLRMTAGPGGVIPTVLGPKGELVIPAFISPGKLKYAVPDGVVNTLLVVEAGSAVPWTKPDELLLPGRPVAGAKAEPPKEPKLPAFGGVFSDGFHAALLNGTVVFYKSDYPATELAKLFCPDDGLRVDPFEPADKVGYTVPLPRDPKGE